jgi:hypothetical protein
MSKARLVITAVVVEGRSQSAVAREYGVSQGWISRLGFACQQLAAMECALLRLVSLEQWETQVRESLVGRVFARAP